MRAGRARVLRGRICAAGAGGGTDARRRDRRGKNRRGVAYFCGGRGLCRVLRGEWEDEQTRGDDACLCGGLMARGAGARLCDRRRAGAEALTADGCGDARRCGGVADAARRGKEETEKDSACAPRTQVNINDIAAPAPAGVLPKTAIGYLKKIMESGGTLTIQLYLSMAKAQYDVAFGIALVLLVIVFLINMLARGMSKKLQVDKK